MSFQLGPRRAVYLDVAHILKEKGSPVSAEEVKHFEAFDLIYRSLCALLFNYVPASGHPGIQPRRGIPRGRYFL